MQVAMQGGQELGFIKWLPTHKARGCLQYHVHAGLAIAEDTRHCFHGVVNLTNVCSTQVHGED